MMSEIQKAAQATNNSHRMLAWNAEQINRSFGEGTGGSSDGVAWYFGTLITDIRRMIDRVEDSQDAHALDLPSVWCNQAREHADAAAQEAAKLMRVRDDHAQQLIDITAEAVKATREWSEVAADPYLFIPSSVIEHLQLAIDGLQGASKAATARGQAIQEQGEDLARRANEACENFLF